MALSANAANKNEGIWLDSSFLIGLTATPSKQTFGFFNRNLVMEYDHERAVADGVNVNYDVYRIKTKIAEKGSSVKAGYYIDKRDRDTRKVRWEKLEEDFDYDPNELDRNVVSKDQIRTIVSIDEVLVAEFSAEALEKAKGLVQSFEEFIKQNKDEITALQILFSTPYKSRLRFEDIKELAEQIDKPPRYMKVDALWNAYAALDKSKVKKGNAPHILTDLVSLVRFAIHRENELIPFPEKAKANFRIWLAQQEADGKKFNQEQHKWLKMIRDHIAASLPVKQHGRKSSGSMVYAPHPHFTLKTLPRVTGVAMTTMNW